MKAFLRHTLRSADSNKGQVAVILLTIVIVTAMIFIAFCMSDVFFNINMIEYDRVAQGADMLLGSNNYSSEFFSKARVERLLDEKDVESYYCFSKFSSILKTDTASKTVLVEATDMTKYLAAYPLNYIEVFDENSPVVDVRYDVSGAYSPVIVGESFAADAGIRVGQIVEVYLPTYDMYTKLLVKYIVANEGIFGSTADLNILVDFKAVGNQGQISAVYINFYDDAVYDKYDELFEEHFPAVERGEGNGYTYVTSIVKNNTLLFGVGLVFLVATMMLILFTAYLIIARNRMNEMVVFKASGATPRQVAGIMLLEVGLYAASGGLLGLLLGRTLMGLAAYKLLPLASGAITYPFWKYLVSYIIAISVTILATLVPVTSVSKKTVRELTSDNFKAVRAVKPLAFALSSAVLIAVGITYKFLSGTALFILSGALVIAMVAWVYCAIYFVVRFAGYLLRKAAKGGSMHLSGLSVTRNGAMHTVTTLLAVVIAFSFMIVEVVGLVKYAIVPFRSRYEADYTVMLENADDIGYADLQSEICAVDGIASAGYFNSHDFVIPGTEDDEWTLYGVSDFTTLQTCCGGNLSGVTAEKWQATEHPVVLSKDMLLRLGLSVGDTLETYPMSSDFGQDRYSLTIVGVDATITEYDRIGYVKHGELLKMRKSAIYLIQAEEGADETATFIALRDAVEELKVSNCFALEFEEWAYSANKNLSGVGVLLTLLQIAVYAIGAIGILNISIVTIYDRRRELNLYKISGMSSADYLRFALGEGLVIGGAGIALGLVMSYIINLIVPVLGSIIGKYVGLTIFPPAIIFVSLVGFVGFLGMWMLIAAVNKDKKIASINERS